MSEIRKLIKCGEQKGNNRNHYTLVSYLHLSKATAKTTLPCLLMLLEFI